MKQQQKNRKWKKAQLSIIQYTDYHSIILWKSNKKQLQWPLSTCVHITIWKNNTTPSSPSMSKKINKILPFLVINFFKCRIHTIIMMQLHFCTKSTINKLKKFFFCSEYLCLFFVHLEKNIYLVGKFDIKWIIIITVKPGLKDLSTVNYGFETIPPKFYFEIAELSSAEKQFEIQNTVT